MIKLQINELLVDRSHYWLAQTTHIAHSTIRNLASHRSQGLKYATLDKLCDAFNCQPGDLLRKVPEPSRD
jgi:putative transcriptional regulator